MKNLFFFGLMAVGVLNFSINANADEGHATGSDQSVVGKPTKSVKVSRTINIVINDTMRITPEKIVAKKSEIIKFTVTNQGKIRHELVIGSAQELKAHAEMMKQMPDMKHTEANQVILEPGKKGSMVWEFSNAGTLQMACFEPGHFEAGMKGEILVQ